MAKLRIFREKLANPKKLKKELHTLQKKKKRVVFTNGCFDILHLGHVTYLEKARKLGDILVVALNTDHSVKRLKGPLRPIHSVQDRMSVVAALECVDFVTFFDEDTPLELIQFLKPDVLVKGGDYTKATIVGAFEVESWGGKVKVIPLVPEKSTTEILEKIRSL